MYRYAFLMTGNTAIATEVLRATAESAARHLDDEDDNHPGRAKRWLFARAREFCRHLSPLSMPAMPAANVPPAPPLHLPPNALVPTASPADPTANPLPGADLASLPHVPTPDAADWAAQLAGLFSTLPEKERNALILFYLYLFDPAELAAVLEIKPAELGPLLAQARILLSRHRSRYESLFAHAPTVMAAASVAAPDPAPPESPTAAASPVLPAATGPLPPLAAPTPQSTQSRRENPA